MLVKDIAAQQACEMGLEELFRSGLDRVTDLGVLQIGSTIPMHVGGVYAQAGVIARKGEEVDYPGCLRGTMLRVPCLPE